MMKHLRIPQTPPQNIAQLFAYAEKICGYSIAELAQGAGVRIPANLKQHKGFAGQLVELYLGAEAGSKPLPDFVSIGVELKTLPVTPEGQALESTFVCSAPLNPAPFATFEQSNVYRKLKQVLWIPLITDKGQSLLTRVIGPALLWRPDTPTFEALKKDWEELFEYLCTGRSLEINASIGEILQIRPKAASGRVRRSTLDPEGNPIEINPKGYYLRAGFTSSLIRENFIC